MRPIWMFIAATLLSIAGLSVAHAQIMSPTLVQAKTFGQGDDFPFYLAQSDSGIAIVGFMSTQPGSGDDQTQVILLDSNLDSTAVYLGPVGTQPSRQSALWDNRLYVSQRSTINGSSEILVLSMDDLTLDTSVAAPIGQMSTDSDALSVFTLDATKIITYDRVSLVPLDTLLTGTAGRARGIRKTANGPLFTSQTTSEGVVSNCTLWTVSLAEQVTTHAAHGDTVIFVASTSMQGSGVKIQLTGLDPLDGSVKWNYIIPGYNSGVTGVTPYLPGQIIVYGGKDDSLYVMGVNTNGDILWEITYKPDAGVYSCWDVVVDESRNRLLVLGEKRTTSGDMILLEYALNPLAVTPAPTHIPVDIVLHQNYPNPFNPTTTIEYSLDRTGWVELAIYNSLGQQVTVLTNQKQPAGSHSVIFSAENLPSGAYFYRLSIEGQAQTRKMILLK